MIQSDTIAIQSALSELKSIPQDNGEPVFSQPWQAQAFAMAVSLNEKGVFTWAEWVQAFSKQISADGDPQSYYLNWMDTLETILNDKGLVINKERIARSDAWDRASRATPHGEPIVLGRENNPNRIS